MSSNNNLESDKSPKEKVEQKVEENNKSSQINDIKKEFKDSKSLNQKKDPKKDIHPLDFYALGKVHDPPIYTSTFCHNKGFRSTSNDLITRNLFSLNTTQFDNLKKNKFNSTLSQQNIKENNYLRPLDVYNTYQKYSIPSNVINKETYNIAKEKLFTKSCVSSIRKGIRLSLSNYIDYKKQLMTENISMNKTMKDKCLERKRTESDNRKMGNRSNELNNRLDTLEKIEKNKKNNSINNGCDSDILGGITKPPIKYINPIDFSKKDLKSNMLYFDKNNQQFLRHKNWWIVDGNKEKTKISDDAPEWFDVFPSWKVKQYNDYIAKNQTTLNVLSKQQNWITVSSKTKDRRHPLEKIIQTKKETTSKIMPEWMESKYKDNKKEDDFKLIDYYPTKQKAKQLLIYVDKELNPSKIKPPDYNPMKSVFSYCDFRNNVLTKKQHEYYDSKVSQLPKQFLHWDDGTQFNPKYKRDK